MKVQDLIDELERYKSIYGNDDVEFWVSRDWGGSETAELYEVHDGYSDQSRECEIRLKL